MIIERTKYKEAPSADWVIFTRPEHTGIYPALAGRIAYMCSVKQKKAICTRGKTTSDDQMTIIKALLSDNPTWKLKGGALYDGSKMMASAPGQSNHEYGHAADLSDWAKEIGNSELAQYGLYKPMSYEPWHYQLIETKGKAKTVLQAHWKEWCNNMGVDKLQSAAAAIGLYNGKVDKINGPQTRAAAKELIKLCHAVLDTDYKTAEEAIKFTQNSPPTWLPRLKEIPYFDIFIMNIVNKMKGLR